MQAKDATLVYAGLECLLNQADILFLGECTDCTRIENIVSCFNKEADARFIGRHFVVDGRRNAEENKPFHTICIYDEERFYVTSECEATDYLKLSDDEDGKYYRVGQRYDYYSSMLSEVVSFFVVHWSQYSEEDGEAMKVLAAHQLRHSMSGSSAPYRLCLGDFNCEPYAKAMAALGASRSSDYVSDRGGFFNPAWAYLSTQYGSLASENTRFMKTDSPLFDQILLDQNLMAERGVLYDFDVLDSKVYTPRKGEHHPVTLTIIKKQRRRHVSKI